MSTASESGRKGGKEREKERVKGVKGKTLEEEKKEERKRILESRRKSLKRRLLLVGRSLLLVLVYGISCFCLPVN